MVAVLLAGLALPTIAEAKIPIMKGTCPDGLEVTAKVVDGPVYFNGKEAMVTIYNKDFAIAKLDVISVGIALDANDALSLQYENPKTGVNILCKIEKLP
jgi:hypothetical protein